MKKIFRLEGNPVVLTEGLPGENPIHVFTGTKIRNSTGMGRLWFFDCSWCMDRNEELSISTGCGMESRTYHDLDGNQVSSIVGKYETILIENRVKKAVKMAITA